MAMFFDGEVSLPMKNVPQIHIPLEKLLIGCGIMVAVVGVVFALLLKYEKQL